MKKRILITSGGTGGHIFPAVALGALLKKKYEVFYSFDPRSANYVDLKAANTFVIDISNKKEAGIIGKLKYLIHIMLAILQARSIIKKVKPDLIIGFGGYTTFPILFAASLLSPAKIILHESNSVLGKVNEMFLPKASLLAGGFETIEGIEPKAKSKFIFTGTPLRSAISKIARKTKIDKINLLIFGGSQAAKKFSEIIPAAILKLDDKIKSRLHVIQQVKEEDSEQVKNLYLQNHISCEIKSFFTDIEQKYATSSLVIARAGASTISELIKLKIPSILIPLPSSAKNHQYKNALFLKNQGCAELAEEDNLTGKNLAEKIALVIQNKAKYEANLAKLDIDSDKILLNLVDKLLKL